MGVYSVGRPSEGLKSLFFGVCYNESLRFKMDVSGVSRDCMIIIVIVYYINSKFDWYIWNYKY